jgi:hypothetical protein
VGLKDGKELREGQGVLFRSMYAMLLILVLL